MIEATDFKPIQIDLKYPDLPSLNQDSDFNDNDYLQDYLDAIQQYYQSQPIFSNEKDQSFDMPIDLTIKSTSNRSGYNQVKQTIDKMIPDQIKKSILLKIAEKESNFNPQAKSKKSTASGLFGFIDKTKKLFGYGESMESQIAGASNLYDTMLNQLKGYISKYGTRGKSMPQLIYGMWFRPKSLLNYLATGTDNFKDASGVTLNNIFAKMAKNGGILKKQDGGNIIPKAPSTFRQYGIDSTKFVNMWKGLVDNGISPQVAFDATWQANKELPKGFYAFGKKKPNINSWINSATDSLTTGAYKASQNAQNFTQYRNATLKYNRNPEYTKWLKTNRQDAVNFINQYKLQNNITGKPITQSIPIVNLLNQVQI